MQQFSQFREKLLLKGSPKVSFDKENANWGLVWPNTILHNGPTAAIQTPAVIRNARGILNNHQLTSQLGDSNPSPVTCGQDRGLV